MNRRGFLDWFLGTATGALFASVLYPVIRFLIPPRIEERSADQVEAGAANDPQLIEKGFKVVRFGAEPVIVVRLPDGELRAFAATCTHLQCIVEYRKPKGVIWCNCHNGQFDLTGRNVAGPPPKPLATFKVHVVRKGTSDPGTLVVSRA